MTKLDRSFDLSRNPSDYSKSTHYFQRKKERLMVEDDIVERTIEDGEVEGVDSNGVKLRLEEKFVTLEVVVAPKEEVVQTAYEVEG